MLVNWESYNMRNSSGTGTHIIEEKRALYFVLSFVIVLCNSELL